MSYTYNNKIRYEDSIDLDAFGRLRTSGITSLLELKHIHDKLPLIVDEKTNGTATSTWSSSYAEVQMTVATTGDYVIRQSKSRGIYQPGKGQLMEASFSSFQLQTNVIKRIGYFTSTSVSPYNSTFDGFFIESNGQTGIISFQIWRNGTQIYSVASTSWLTDDYDITSIDWSLTNLMLVDFQWLGVGRVRFGLVIDGTVRVFATHTGANLLSNVYMKNPNQPIRYEIRSVAAAAAGSLNMICSQVSMEGSINNLQKSVLVDNFTTRTLPTSGTKYPLIGYRINSGYFGANITLSDIQTINVTTPSKADFLVTIELNPTLSATPTFNNIANTPVDYAMGTGAQTVTSAGSRIAGFIGSGTSVQVDSFEFKDNVLRPGVGIDGTQDQVWICITASGNNQDFRSAINLSYFD